MRIFHGTVFLGSGDHSKQAVEALHARLDDAVSALGGLQQSRNPDEATLDAEARVELEEVVRDLVSALLGREVQLTDVQPYPPNDGRIIHTYWEAKRGRALDKLRDANVTIPPECECQPKALYQLLHCPAHRRGVYRPLLASKVS